MAARLSQEQKEKLKDPKIAFVLRAMRASERAQAPSKPQRNRRAPRR